MSHALDIADLIAARLAAAPATGELAVTQDITGCPILVDRQKNLLSDIQKAVGKTGGTAIVILWQGFTSVDDNAGTPRLLLRYTISVWSKPILTSGDLPADDIMETILRRLWQWLPESGHAFGEMKLKSGGLVPDSRFLIYDCEVSVAVSI
jgi:hypothetical protein